eukprot:gene20947-20873_t
MTGILHFPSLFQLSLLVASMLGIELAEAAVRCERNLVANVVALDQPLMFNRLGAQNANGMMFALRRDVVDDHERSLAQGGSAVPGNVSLRPDKRPRPLVLRVAAGECLTVNLQNLLAYSANPASHESGGVGEIEGSAEIGNAANFKVDEQVSDRYVGFQINGMQAVNSIDDISSYSGRNANTLIAPGATRSYTLYAEREGAFAVSSRGATFGGEGDAGNVANGLFGEVVVVPKGGRSYRNTVTEEEMRLASSGRTPAGQPIVDYQTRYPQRE